MIKIENKLYSSTEVADILGVSLRSVYRYLEEGKLQAEVKTATGRHRFTRQNIVDFLYPSGMPEEEMVEQRMSVSQKEEVRMPVSEARVEVEAAPKVPAPEPIKEPEVSIPVAPQPKMEVETQKVEAEKEDDQVDWLAKFREAAKKFEETTEQFSGLGDIAPEPEEIVPVMPKKEIYFYRSRLGGLKDVAQNIDKTSKNSGLDYAFTLNAGLSLYKPINPFSLLHVYVRPKDRDFFERILALTPSDEGNAQLCILVSDENALYAKADEMHGLKVVDKKRLIEDISEMKEDLLKEAESILI
ncbi:helix-turn-helix domain-containing protein [Patescibacteria group bacterium]|nr:helix-turn-helix domain-containing protein [Patescibacteria group bacterium]